MEWNNEMERSFMLCVCTYVNLYGVMPSTKEMCRQLGCTNEVRVGEALRSFKLPSLMATA